MPNDVLFKYGTRADYDALNGNVKDNALYFLTDTGELLRGDRNLGQANHYEGIRQEGETDAQVITRVVGSHHLIKNDIFVVKTLIAEDKYSFTAYTYDGTNWCAMDGNYNAENIYFDKNFTVTEAIGTIKDLPNGQATLEAAGKNLKEVLAALFAKEQNPTITQPSVAITANKMKAYEVGTKVTPDYTATFNSGKYQYGPATGVAVTAWSVTDTDSHELTTTTGTFPELTVGDNTNYKITATATYGDGVAPKTNLGNEYAAGKIQAGSKSKDSAAITGYRSFFYGVVKTDVLNSAVIRGLTNGGAYNSAKTLTVTVNGADGVGIVVAVPADSTRTGVKEVLLTTSMNADITADYVVSTPVDVEGANGYTAKSYKIYFYKPAKLTSGQSHKITLA